MAHFDCRYVLGEAPGLDRSEVDRFTIEIVPDRLHVALKESQLGGSPSDVRQRGVTSANAIGDPSWSDARKRRNRGCCHRGMPCHRIARGNGKLKGARGHSRGSHHHQGFALETLSVKDPHAVPAIRLHLASTSCDSPGTHPAHWGPKLGRHRTCPSLRAPSPQPATNVSVQKSGWHSGARALASDLKGYKTAPRSHPEPSPDPRQSGL